MKTVAKIIAAFGGLERLRQPGNYIRLESPPYMRLVIEYIGQGPRGLPAIAVAHYYEQNGDAMRDPETKQRRNECRYRMTSPPTSSNCAAARLLPKFLKSRKAHTTFLSRVTSMSCGFSGPA